MNIWWIDDEHGGLGLRGLEHRLADHIELEHVLFQGDKFKDLLQGWMDMADEKKQTSLFLVDMLMPKVPGYDIDYSHEYAGVSVAKHLVTIGFIPENIALYTQFSEASLGESRGEFKLLEKSPRKRQSVIDWIGGEQ